jgi:hypothetical protein
MATIDTVMILVGPEHDDQYRALVGRFRQVVGHLPRRGRQRLSGTDHDTDDAHAPRAVVARGAGAGAGKQGGGAHQRTDGHPKQARTLSRDPSENAPRKGTSGRRIHPSTFPEHRLGPLRFVPRPSGPSLLVADGVRASFSRQTGELRGFQRATERARRSGQGLTTVVMLLLVPQVKLPKRLDVARTAERWSAQLPALIQQRLWTE